MEHYSEEAKNFMNAMRIINNNPIKDYDEKRFFFEAWYKIIHAECCKEYTMETIKKIKRNIINGLKEKLEERQSELKIGFDYEIQTIYQAEENEIKRLIEKIEYIQNSNDEEMRDMIVRSLTPIEEIETLKEEKSIKEKEKLSELSYKGKNCVDDNEIDSEIAKKIYDELKNSDLLNITARVSEAKMKNKQFINLQNTKVNARSIVYFKIIEIYEEKIEKIISEIKQELGKISKSKYSEYINTNNLSLIRLKSQIEEDYKKSQSKIQRFINPAKEEKYKILLSTIEGTIDHENKMNEYISKLELEYIEDEILEIYNKTMTSREITEKKTEVLSNTGIIINNLGEDIIELYVKNFIKEIDNKAIELNNQITELATREEQLRIEAFAKKLGMTIENTLKLLKNKDNIYICLYTYIYGTEIEKGIDTSEKAEEVLIKIDSRFEDNKRKINQKIDAFYLPYQKENTKPIKTNKQKQLKLPNKNN